MNQPLQVLYEDNHLIAVYKPAGVLVQADHTKQECLMDFVKKYLKEKYAKPGDVFLGLMHRLDRNVGGIVLFAKTSKGASRLSGQFRDHSVVKIYHAWVEGIPPQKAATLKNYLMHSEKGNISKVFETAALGAAYAELSYEVVQEMPATSSPAAPARSLLKIELKTGRHHQIRAQLSHLGHPIFGDVKYGAAKAFDDQHIALYATELHFNAATATAVPAKEIITKDGSVKDPKGALPAATERKILSIPVPEESC
ncbi:MAG: rluC [Candidatus Taylorbacteria bacterium]|nr:rluC [Candidatus Taylorbacteria bacterium]